MCTQSYWNECAVHEYDEGVKKNAPENMQPGISVVSEDAFIKIHVVMEAPLCIAHEKRPYL